MAERQAPRRAPDGRKWIGMGVALACALGGAALAFSLQAPARNADQAVAAAGFDAREREAIEAVVREYILAHPEILPQAMEKLREREAGERVTVNRERIFAPFPGAEAGNPDGDVTVVEFADYACGFCRQSVADVERLLREDPNVRIVFRELPILSEQSREASRMALAAAEQGRFMAFHRAIYKAGRLNEASIAAAAGAAGLDMERAKGFLASDRAAKEIEANLDLARQLRFGGTPSWVVGNRLLEGAVGYEALKEAVDAARKAG